MRKRTLLLFFLCAISVSSKTEGGYSARGGKEETVIAYFLPQIYNDFADLDVRDAQNRPVESASASQNLESLFRQNLVNLMVFSTPHVVASTQDWIISISHLLFNNILRRVLPNFGPIFEAWAPNLRRFVHNVHILWISLFAAAFLGGVMSCRRCPHPSQVRLNRRC